MTCFHLLSSHHQGFCFEAHLAKTRAKRLPTSCSETVFASQPAFCTCHWLLLVYSCCMFQVSISRMFQIRNFQSDRCWPVVPIRKCETFSKHSMTSCVYEYTVVPRACHLLLWCSLLMTPWQQVSCYGLCQVLIGQDSCNKLARSFQSWLNRRWNGAVVSAWFNLFLGRFVSSLIIDDFLPFSCERLAHCRHVLVQVLAVVLWKPYKDCHLMCYKVTWPSFLESCRCFQSFYLKDTSTKTPSLMMVCRFGCFWWACCLHWSWKQLEAFPRQIDEHCPGCGSRSFG